ncbi:MAG: ATP-dependent nuclease [Candidatus Nealsonbacteria bacterium]
MKIKKITIKNFKSIKDQVSFEIKKIGGKSAYILLGINESGKSNILDAISLINGDYDVDYSIDCNSEAEEAGDDILVTYELVVESPSFYKKKFIESGIPKGIVAKIKLDFIERNVSFSKENERNDFFHIYIKSDKEFSKYVISGKNIELRTEENVEKDEAGDIKNILGKGKLESYLEDNFFDLFDANMPKVIFWKSESKYLIDKKIDLNEFKKDPKISIPLMNCFKIAGIDNVEKSIDAISEKIAKKAMLAQRLSEGVTAHINRVWKEYEVNVRFEIDNMQLSFLIEDRDNDLPKYEITQRSDGFKHFISILLNLSVENKMQDLRNKIILLDEPEVHLHPSGQKYLRDELLVFGKNNAVFFATHSIYIVDTKNIDRHFSVKKKNGITQVFQIERDNPYKEEVLYESLGTSVLELIEPNVLILEGKTDRDIFELYVRKFKKELKPPKVTTISADGCTNIIRYTKFFNTKIVKGYVLVDSDDEGMREKKKILKVIGYNNKNTFEINDILDVKKNATLEDLFDRKYLVAAIREKYGLDMKFDADKSYIGQARDKLHENKKPFREIDKKELKKLFFIQISKIQKDELKKEKYFKLCKNLCDKIA